MLFYAFSSLFLAFFLMPVSLCLFISNQLQFQHIKAVHIIKWSVSLAIVKVGVFVCTSVHCKPYHVRGGGIFEKSASLCFGNEGEGVNFNFHGHIGFKQTDTVLPYSRLIGLFFCNLGLPDLYFSK